MDCIFCKIIAGEIPANIAYEDDQLLAFHDISPQAPSHILIIPKRHIATLNDLNSDDADLISHMVLTATKLADKQSLAKSGYRLVWNCNEQGGQEVFHIHLHLMGGRVMHWPPG